MSAHLAHRTPYLCSPSALPVTYCSLISYTSSSFSFPRCAVRWQWLSWSRHYPPFMDCGSIALFTTAPTLPHPQSNESNRHHTLLHFPFPFFSPTTFNTVQITRISGRCFVLYFRLQAKCVFQTYSSVVTIWTILASTHFYQKHERAKLHSTVTFLSVPKK